MASAIHPVRANLLLRPGRAHRYKHYRALSQAFTLGVLLAVPLLGLARVDLWRGDHRLLFAPAPLPRALAGVILVGGSLYVCTFLINLVAGRLFCGWGCPVGQGNRLGEAALAAPTRLARARGHVLLGLYSAACVLAALAWWTDLRILTAGGYAERVASLGVVLVGSTLAVVQGVHVRWEFCKTACPIGLYYSLVAPARWFGVSNAEPRKCITCNACDAICPVNLAPRELLAPIPARGGLSLGGAPGRNHCLECGDCVRACELVLRRRSPGPYPLRLGFAARAKPPLVTELTHHPGQP